MALYLISYDIQSGHDYGSLYAALRQLNAQRVLLSVWATKRVNTTSADLRNFLQAYIHRGDRLLVIDADDWAAWDLMADPNKM